MILTSDLAEMFAKSIDLPEDANGKRIDIGMSRPVTMHEIVELTNAKLHRHMSVIDLPKFISVPLTYIMSWISPTTAELLKMFSYFDSGVYVNDPTLQEQYYGKPPTPEETVDKYVDKLLAAGAVPMISKRK